MLNNKIKAVSLALVLILCLTMLTGCFDPYAKYRYPTAKEAMEAEGYEVKKVYGEVEINGLVCFMFDNLDVGGKFSYAILIQNRNGYCAVDPYMTESAITDTYNEEFLIYISTYKKFSKYIVVMFLFFKNEKPNIIDSLDNQAAIIETGQGYSMAFFISKKIPKNYKVCVDGIWYPMPKTDSD